MEAGRARALGMIGRGRSAAMPAVSSFAEQGLEGFDVTPFGAA